MEINKDKPSGVGLAAGAALLIGCLCLLVAGIGGYAAYSFGRAVSSPNSPIFTAPPLPGAPVKEPEIVRPGAGSITMETLETLEKTIVPERDPYLLACRLKGICNVPRVMAKSAAPRLAGEKQNFWAHDLGANRNNETTATLLYVTPHVYFWAQDGLEINEHEMKALVDAFEDKIYPTNREFFGSESSPGIDGDEHIYILYSRGLGSSVAGYFSSSDSLNPLIQEFSNGHEMFFFNAENTPLGGGYAYAVLAHEFQHMIHSNNDMNETSWLNEGSSELATLLNGYETGGFDTLYIYNPDLQLNDWPNDRNATAPHYGAGYLFMTYFLSRFGGAATQWLVNDPANGLESVDDVLRKIGANDPLTNQPIAADDLFLDWILTNLLLDPSIGDGRYAYNNYSNARRAFATETFRECPQEAFSRTVHQYGADYIAFECAGDYAMRFTGSTVTGLLPAGPKSGDYAFWSNKGDESDMTLTREFDLTNVSAPIELTFNAWYDIETDWDYVYLEVSENGETWEILATPSGTGANPSGNSYGWGYTGVSGGWIEETADLSAYAGKKVLVRFEYVTDAAVNGEGFMVDDVRVEAAGYRSGFEADAGGWIAEGFARVRNILPQTFRLALVKAGDASVMKIPLNPDQTAEISISLKPGETAYLAVAGTTRFTRELASYQIEIR